MHSTRATLGPSISYASLDFFYTLNLIVLKDSLNQPFPIFLLWTGGTLFSSHGVKMAKQYKNVAVHF